MSSNLNKYPLSVLNSFLKHLYHDASPQDEGANNKNDNNKKDDTAVTDDDKEEEEADIMKIKSRSISLELIANDLEPTRMLIDEVKINGIKVPYQQQTTTTPEAPKACSCSLFEILHLLHSVSSNISTSPLKSILDKGGTITF